MARSTLVYVWFLVVWATLPAAARFPTATKEANVDGAPRVARVTSQHLKSPNRAALGDAVIVEIRGLAALLDPSRSQVHCRDLILFLDGMAVQGSPPESCSPYEGRIRFRLDRTDKSDSAWHILLSKPTSYVKTVTVSVGSSADLAYPTDVRDFELEVLPRSELICSFAMLAISVALFVRLALKTSILRTRGPTLEGQKAPFSLARFQLAFWSMLVIAAYIFIWMLTNELDTITGSVLVLLGIGSGTALSAALIDSGKPASTGQGSPAEAAVPDLPRASQGFLNDLLSDDHGISIYRFQLFAWTLVLGVIFCASVYDGLQMPQFSSTLLGLMGLSSGAYLGFKVPEGKSQG